MIKTILLLSGCGGTERDREKFLQWREDFVNREEISINANLTVSGGGRFSEYKLQYNKTTEGETVEVLEPKLIANVRASRRDGATWLSFEGVVLETGAIAEERKLSPMMALPTFVDSIKRGHLEQTWREKLNDETHLVSDLEMPDGTILTLWQRKDDMMPVYGAFRSGASVVLRIKINEII